MAKLTHWWPRHKSWGITILGLAVIRLVWRLANRQSPPLPEHLKPWERAAAHVTHYGLYSLLFGCLSPAGPVVGPQVPGELVQSGAAARFHRAESAAVRHASLPCTCGCRGRSLRSPCSTSVAALKHHFVLKDDVLRRMLPFTRT